MESSFKGNYTTVANPDGSFTINFKHELLSAGMWVLLALPLVVIAMLIASAMSPKGVNMTFFVLFIALAIGLTVGLGILTKVNTSIQVVPNEGIKWSSHSATFDDIDSFVVITNTYKGSATAKTWSRISIHMKGREVYLTKWLRLPLAEGVKDEILRCSGRKWS